MEKLRKPRAVIFDWDNTLVDTWPIIHEAINATFSYMRLPLWSFETTKQRVRKSMRDSFPEIFGKDWQDAADFYQRQYRTLHLNKLQPLTNAEDVLKKIRELGLYSTIVSNKKGGNLRKEVEYLGWKNYFDRTVGSDDAARDKPFSDPAELAFSGSSYKLGKDVWFIGDSDIDLECAKNTNCTAILYGPTPKEHGKFTSSHFNDMPYHAYVANHSELLNILKFTF